VRDHPLQDSGRLNHSTTAVYSDRAPTSAAWLPVDTHVIQVLWSGDGRVELIRVELSLFLTLNKV
jgi:hypothetical protein